MGRRANAEVELRGSRAVANPESPLDEKSVSCDEQKCSARLDRRHLDAAPALCLREPPFAFIGRQRAPEDYGPRAEREELSTPDRFQEVADAPWHGDVARRHAATVSRSRVSASRQSPFTSSTETRICRCPVCAFGKARRIVTREVVSMSRPSTSRSSGPRARTSVTPAFAARSFTSTP